MKGRGVLLPVFSLPGQYGIGTLGDEAYRFADFLAQTGQNFWQVLPVNPTTWGDSPYQSPGSFAGNPYFIDPGLLEKDGLLTVEECALHRSRQGKIKYKQLAKTRYVLFQRAYQRFDKHTPAYLAFCRQEAYWLDAYALFMAIKDLQGGAAWQNWPHRLRNVKSAKEDGFAEEGAGFYRFLQYQFQIQWDALKAYCNRIGVSIIGDLPIYVAADSADVWAERRYFCLDDRGNPLCVAGVPPDAFSKTGQLWGNPLYDWKTMRQDGFAWWHRRFARCFGLFDAVRVDHFRGFAGYYAVPYGEKTAKKGNWLEAPGKELFASFKRVDWQFIAEDLGLLDDAVRELLQETGFPGMKVLQFAFDSDDSEYLPENYPQNCAAYTGTHDNTTLQAFLRKASRAQRKRIESNVPRREGEELADAMIRALLSSAADTVIIPLPDYMGLGKKARINTPATVRGNWIWRLAPAYATQQLRDKMLSF